MTRLLRRLLGKFEKSQAIVSVKDVTEVPYQDVQNQHDDTLLAVGLNTREYMKENEDEIPQQVIHKFFRYLYMQLNKSHFSAHNDISIYCL